MRFAKEVRAASHPDTRNLVAESDARPLNGSRPWQGTIAVVDCGVKRNSYGRRSATPPCPGTLRYDVGRDPALKTGRVILSKRPGDPAHPDIVATSVRTTRELAGRVPSSASVSDTSFCPRLRREDVQVEVRAPGAINR